ncbi:hypothetical protein CEXT_263571 [Caerostris extrusa]|uniref:Uncharacterized protein n=1 Tax=Caerostris extrusa TaxID=172846 RepID=A0AAV4UKN0_CAEEX|nr:hypothetical protein CEXT_263571 [Caerostris extrusa]
MQSNRKDEEAWDLMAKWLALWRLVPQSVVGALCFLVRGLSSSYTRRLGSAKRPSGVPEEDLRDHIHHVK